VKRVRQSEEEAAQYGFRWGHLDVTRNMEHRGGKSLSVETDYQRITVYVSPGGRSIRVWKNHEEMK
jgi:hypothetical protein